MRKVFVLVVLALVASFAVACGKGPAEAALKAADEAVAAAKPDAEKFVPDQFKALADAVAAAHARFDQGEYSAVVEAVKDIPMRAGDVTKAAAAKKAELTTAWTELGTAVPGMVAAVRTQIEELAKAKKLPKGIDAAKVTALQTELAAVDELWTKATGDFQGGNLTAALEAANQVKGKVAGLAADLAPAPPAETKAGLKK